MILQSKTFEFVGVLLTEQAGAMLWRDQESELAKGATHKYIKRVPIPGKPGRYKYYYHAAHGGTVGHGEHLVVGAAFKVDGGHAHITEVKGGKVTIRHDETGEVETVSKAELTKRLTAHHRESLEDKHKERVRLLEAAAKHGAKGKAVDRLHASTKALAKVLGEKAPDGEPEKQAKSFNLEGKKSADEIVQELGLKDVKAKMLLGLADKNYLKSGLENVIANKREILDALEKLPVSELKKLSGLISFGKMSKKELIDSKWAGILEQFVGDKGTIDEIMKLPKDVQYKLNGLSDEERARLIVEHINENDLKPKPAPEVKYNEPEQPEVRLKDQSSLKQLAQNKLKSAEERHQKKRLINTARRSAQDASAEWSAIQDSIKANKILAIVEHASANPTSLLGMIQTEKQFEELEKIKDLGEWGFEEIFKPFAYDSMSLARFLRDKEKDTRKRLPKELSPVLNAIKDRRDIAENSHKLINLIEKHGLMSHEDKRTPYAHYKSVLRQATTYGRIVKQMGVKNAKELNRLVQQFKEVTENVGGLRPSREKELLRKVANTKIPGYFPTPPQLVSELSRLADIKPGETVLEPSAGKGDIADHLRKKGAIVSTIEKDDDLREILGEKGHDVVGGNTLEHFGKYDKVVMNPPFEKGQDIEHVKHAFEHNLNVGGKLVAVMSEGSFYRNDKKAKEFRDWLDSMGGKSIKNPEGSFKTSDNPTGVNTRTVVITKYE